MSPHRASPSGSWEPVDVRGPLRRAAAYLVAGAILAAVVGWLLVQNFQAAAQRRADVLRQHATALSLQAAVLGHSLDTAERLLRTTTETLEWPPARGALEPRLVSLVTPARYGEEPVFDLVAALDETGGQLAAAGQAGGSAVAAWTHRLGAPDPVGLGPGGADVVAVVPVGSPERPRGFLVGFLSPESVARALVHEWQGAGRPLHGYLVDEREVAYAAPGLRHEAPLPPGHAQVAADGIAVPILEGAEDGQGARLVARVRIPGRALWLVDVSTPEDLLREVPTEARLTALAAAMALALGVAGLGVFLNVRALVRRTREEESTAREREVGEKAQELERESAERQRAEQARAVLANALEQSTEAVAIADPSLRIGHVNPAFERLVGRTAAEVSGRPYLEALGAAQPAGAPDPELETATREGRPWRGDLTGHRSDGAPFDAKVSLSPVRDERGRLTHHVLTARDVTEARRERERRRHLQRLESIGTLAGGVAHDFNNVLTAINGYAGLAIEGLPPGDPVREDVEEIQKAGARAADLTRQLLAFGRRQVLHPEPVDPNEVVGGVEKMLRRLIGEDVDLATDLQPGCWRIRADRGQVEQVLVNLAVNARDAMPGGGRLAISTANVVLGEREARRYPEGSPGEFVRLRVVDTGHGMTPEVMTRIFEPFFTTKELGKGTGLGLSTVYGIVRQSRGFVGVTSAPGAGCSFEVFLPRDEAPARPASAPAAPAEAARARGEVVLVVEDADQVRSLLVAQLTARGYAVLAAADGREALDLAGRRRERIDALVTDVVMPRLSGPELARELRRSHPETAVVFMSGYAEEAVLREGSLTGAGAFIAKPFDVADLCVLLRRVLGEARAVSAAR